MTPDRLRANEAVANGQRSERDQAAARMVANAMLMSRAALTRQTGDRRRNLEDECGYPKGYQDAEYYQNLYDKDPIAQRVVQVLPKECFQVSPSVYEDEDADTITAFEEAWDGLGKALRGEDSHYQEEYGSCVWEYLMRLDMLSRIGRYGVALLGTDDGLPLDQPAAGFEEEGSSPVETPRQGEPGRPVGAFGYNGSPYRLSVNARANKGRKLLYMRTFPETLAQITQWEGNPTSPRFGQPVQYLVNFNDPRSPASGLGLQVASLHVHWSRVIHAADNLESSEFLGWSALHPVRYRIEDLMKLYGGSAEMYWLGAFPGLSIEATTPTGEDPNLDVEGLRTMVEYYMNGLQRYMALENAKANMMSPTVVDPTPQIAAQIEAICIRIGCPIRIFKGSERGELASSQDDAAWNDRVKQRQNGHVTPRIIIPFVDRLIGMGVLPIPQDGYRVWWPDITSQSEQEKADVAQKKVTALTTFASGGGEQVMALPDFWTRIMGEDEEETKSIMDNLEEALEDKAEEDALLQQDEMDLQEQKIDRGLVPDPTEQKAKPPTPFGGGGATKPKSPTANADRDEILNILNRETKRKRQRELVASSGWEPLRVVSNIFCPTGPGGGIDPTCSRGVGGGKGDSREVEEGRELTVGGSIHFGGRETPIEYDRELTREETIRKVEKWLANIPEKERSKSSVKSIEVYDNPEDLLGRLKDVGIDPDIGDNGVVRGAFDFRNKRLYTTTWDGEKEHPRTLYHEIGHSILGEDEDLAEGWAKTYLRLGHRPTTMRH